MSDLKKYNREHHKKLLEETTMTKEMLLKTDIPREKGYFYFCGTDRKGNIEIGRAKMARGPNKMSKEEKQAREKKKARIRELAKQIRELKKKSKKKK